MCILGIAVAFVLGGTVGVAGMAILSFERELDRDHE